MKHHRIGQHESLHGFTEVIAADEATPSIPRQIVNGLGGLFVLLLTGIALLVLVLWKAP